MTDRGALRIDKAKGTELDLLVQLNRQLDEDEPHPYPLPLPALTERMARWIDSGEYEVLLFRSGDQLIGYALWRAEELGTYLRHFFICRDRRRQGWGRAAMQRLCRDVFPKDCPDQHRRRRRQQSRHRVLARHRLPGLQHRDGVEGRRTGAASRRAPHSTFSSSSE